MEFLKSWFADSGQSLAEQLLRREVRPGHALFEIDVTPMARRRDRDGVLFALQDGTKRLAVVHLTHACDSAPNYPTVKLFGTFEQ
jgi:hypothetical protein